MEFIVFVPKEHPYYNSINNNTENEELIRIINESYNSNDEKYTLYVFEPKWYKTSNNPNIETLRNYIADLNSGAFNSDFGKHITVWVDNENVLVGDYRYTIINTSEYDGGNVENPGGINCKLYELPLYGYQEDLSTYINMEVGEVMRDTDWEGAMLIRVK